MYCGSEVATRKCTFLSASPNANAKSSQLTKGTLTCDGS